MIRSTKTTQALFALLLAVAILSGCGGSADSPSQASGASVAVAEAAALDLPVTIDAARLDEIRDRDDVVVLDVREDWEFQSGHVPGAQWIPLGQLASRLNEVPKDKTVVAVCRSGNRSGQATTLLRQQGFNAHNMQGGMISWERAGFDIEK